ncbi:MAG: DUF1573 domain-containing protein [Bacteroidaceae bacterium]|nr:DUF1573 domain-containing protein [Bacteroidaceae bacterium]
MKHSGIILAVAAMLAFQVSQAKDDEYPAITFEESTHNFGLFDREHETQTYWFKFKNTGKSELVITSASGTCSCTKAEAPKFPVMPGETDSIKVTFNGAGIRPGVIRKTVIVTSNTKEKTAYLYITGELVEQLVKERLKESDGDQESADR